MIGIFWVKRLLKLRIRESFRSYHTSDEQYYMANIVIVKCMQGDAHAVIAVGILG